MKKRERLIVLNEENWIWSLFQVSSTNFSVMSFLPLKFCYTQFVIYEPVLFSSNRYGFFSLKCRDLVCAALVFYSVWRTGFLWFISWLCRLQGSVLRFESKAGFVLVNCRISLYLVKLVQDRLWCQFWIFWSEHGSIFIFCKTLVRLWNWL